MCVHVPFYNKKRYTRARVVDDAETLPAAILTTNKKAPTRHSALGPWQEVVVAVCNTMSVSVHIPFS